jgi:hypothetical protein
MIWTFAYHDPKCQRSDCRNSAHLKPSYFPRLVWGLCPHRVASQFPPYIRERDRQHTMKYHGPRQGPLVRL